MSEKTEYILTCETDRQAKSLIESLIQLLKDIESGKVQIKSVTSKGKNIIIEYWKS